MEKLPQIFVNTPGASSNIYFTIDDYGLQLTWHNKLKKIVDKKFHKNLENIIYEYKSRESFEIYLERLSFQLRVEFIKFVLEDGISE